MRPCRSYSSQQSEAVPEAEATTKVNQSSACHPRRALMHCVQKLGNLQVAFGTTQV
jgi:hypothetical protein